MKNEYKRIIVVVLDSVGIGALDDAREYGDDASVNTLNNISKAVGLKMPNMEKLGLGNISDFETINKVENPVAYYTKMREKADGKDTLTGHWEMMGVTLEKGFKQYVKNGFPEDLIEEFSRRVGRKVLANKEASGMKVIKEYYDEHIDTGAYIVYTSVDSTFQIAAHEDVIPLDELYRASEIARELTSGEKYNVARVIARPFVGTSKDDFTRTSGRRDYAILPQKETILEKLRASNYDSIAVGKIVDIFSGQGITEYVKTKSNMDGINKTIEYLKKDFTGLLFVNLVDFDMLYGHPRDVIGYKNALEEFDENLPRILENLNEDDLLIITADHGNDPTFKGNDHTREYVPLLIYSPQFPRGKELKQRETFEDIGETVSDNFGLTPTENGNSVLDELK